MIAKSIASKPKEIYKKKIAVKISIIILLAFSNSILAKASNKLHIKGDVYSYYDSEQKESVFFIKSKNRAFKHPEPSHIADFCIWRLTNNLNSDKLVKRTKKERKEIMAYKYNTRNKEHEDRAYVKKRIFFLFFRKLSMVLVNEEAFDLKKGINYHAYYVPNEKINTYYDKVLKIAKKAYWEEIDIVKKTDRMRRLLNSDLWRVDFYSELLPSFYATPENQFKPFKETRGRVELSKFKDKPKFWDYESFQVFREGWNAVMDETNKFIDYIKNGKGRQIKNLDAYLKRYKSLEKQNKLKKENKVKKDIKKNSDKNN